MIVELYHHTTLAVASNSVPLQMACTNDAVSSRVVGCVALLG